MFILKSKWFQRFARREGISDLVLKRTVELAESGLVDADLGGGVIKQRIARSGQGKSGGYRAIIFFRRGDRADLSSDSRRTGWRISARWKSELFAKPRSLSLP